MPTIEPASKRQKEVSAEIGELDSSIARLTKLTEDLESALSTVLTQPTPSDAESKEEQPLTPLATEIRGARYRIATQICILESIITRLEL